MENAIHQSLIRSSTTRGGAPRDTSSEKSPSRSALDKTSRARGRDGLDACFPDAAFARAPRGSRRSMPEPGVDASLNVCGDQWEGSAAFCALLPQCPIERSAPLPLIPGLVYRSPTVARSVTTGLSLCHDMPRHVRAPHVYSLSAPRQGSVRRAFSVSQRARPARRGRRSRSLTGTASSSSRSRRP